MKIPFYGLRRQGIKLHDELLEATSSVIKTGEFIGGQYTQELEDWLSRYIGVKYVVTVHSGTQALELLARAAREMNVQIGHPQPIVHVPNFTYPATLNAFLNTGWNVILEDTDENGIINSSAIDTPPGTYVCQVGLYGANPHRHKDFGNFFSSPVIVDGAQHWPVANSMFDVGLGMSISFDPTKNLPATGNGGAIVTDHKDLYARVKAYRDNGKNSLFTMTGTNSKMSEQDCAHVLVRTKYFDDWQARRDKISRHWCTVFSDLPIRCLRAGITEHANQKFVIYSDSRGEMRQYLFDHGIETKINYEYVLSDLEIGKNLLNPSAFSVSGALSRGVLSLPIYPELTDIEVDYITKTVREFFHN